MAGSSHLLKELRRQLERLDDEGFAALASVGLLRRARKDLESHSPELQTREDAVLVKLAAHEVTLDARGPANARCTCPAKTTCQHILAACIFLKSLPDDGAAKEDVSTNADQASLQGEIMSITLPALIRHAGKPAVREALQTVDSEETAQLSFDKALVIRLVKPGVEFRYVGGGPESLITDFRGRSAKKLAVQAILALQRAHGMSHVLPGDAQKRTTAQVQGNDVHELRHAVLAKVERLLRECIDVGLTHLSDTLIERCMALATVAEGAKLHRLSLALSRLSDQVDLILERHARADSDTLFRELGSTYALTSALRDPRSWDRVELVGEARSSYEEAATLDLHCAGAYPWQTSSGYWGLTVLFWSAEQARWFSYSDSRPLGTLGFSPTDAYRMGGPWRGCRSPAEIMGHRLTLSRASANRLGRLSGGNTPTAEVSPAASVLPDFGSHAYRSWSSLRAHARANLDGVGLIERNPHADYVVLYPHQFLTRGFEGTTQTLLWPIEDQDGEQLLLRLEYSTIAAAAVERLDALQPASGIGILAQLSWSAGMLSARPLSLLREDGRIVDNLFLDEPPATGRAQALFGKLRATLAARSSGKSVDPPLHPMHATERMLNQLDEILLNAAERGAASREAYAQELAGTLRRLQDSGLTLVDADASIDAETLLRARYLSRLTRECLARDC